MTSSSCEGAAGACPVPEHRLQHALDDLHDVLFALAQVRVRPSRRIAHEVVHLQHERPFALQRRLPISSRGTTERLESLSSIACRLRIAFISAGAPADTLACSAASSPRTWAIARRSARSPLLSPAARSRSGRPPGARSRRGARGRSRSSGDPGPVQGEARAGRHGILARFHGNPTPFPEALGDRRTIAASAPSASSPSPRSRRGCPCLRRAS